MSRALLGINAVVGLLVCGALLLASAAGAASPPSFWVIPGEGGSSSGAAGGLNNPRASSTDPSNGHVYVSDATNRRISEFTAWGEFVRAWGWGVEDGSAEFQICGPVEPQLEPNPSLCQSGQAGEGVGQFAFPVGVAVDDAGSVFVFDRGNARVQKFSSEGEFLLMFGGEVNKTTGADVCTSEDLEGGDECGAGTSGGEAGEFESGVVGNYLAFDPVSETVWVGDVGRIQEFELDGTFKSQITLEGELSGATIRQMAIDSAGNFYLGMPGIEDIRKLDPEGKDTGQRFEVEFTGAGINDSSITALAVDLSGHVYLVSDPPLLSQAGQPRVIAFEPNGTCFICAEDEFGVFAKPGENFSLNGLATNEVCAETGDTGLYLSVFGEGNSHLNAYGPPPCNWPPPPAAPLIEAQYGVSAGSGTAVVKADINPVFWQDTSFQVQYGTSPCSEGGCETTVPGSPVALESGIVNEAVQTDGVLLDGLAPDTTYHFRFVASSSGGGPTVGEEATITTHPLPSPEKADCPNQEFRAGPGASLPDCRAYEMVSPIDKNNGDIVALGNINSDPAALRQSSTSGDALTYSSYRAFGEGVEAAPYTSQYLARRGAEGWSGGSISPPRDRMIIQVGQSGDTEFKQLSPDLCRGWLKLDFTSEISPPAVDGYPNLFGRENCGPVAYQALITTPPPNRPPDLFRRLEFQGAAADGSKAIFRANDALAAGASDPGFANTQLYEWVAGEGLRFVCVLPNGTPLGGESCSAGHGAGSVDPGGRKSNVSGAISEDGSRIFWSAPGTGAGKLYVRLDPEAGSGDEETVALWTADSTARFWTAATDGSVALFTTGNVSDGEGVLRSFDVEAEEATTIAGDVYGVLGASDDASRVYFLSGEVLDEGASEGEPNLYLHEAGEEGGETFIATLSDLDAEVSTEGKVPSAVNIQPYKRTSRATPDGAALAFMSTAPLTGFDNTDADSAAADAEVFHFDAATGELRCASCNPTGVRPSGRNVGSNVNPYWAAAQIPGWENELYPTRSLSDDGDRLFFESFEPLVLRDSNDAADVYEWQPVEDEAECLEEIGGDRYLAYPEGSGGCLALISSGQDAGDSELLDSSPGGADVFFATGADLLDQDPGLIDVYDARIGGGFPAPEPEDEECDPFGIEGEECPEPPPAPQAPEPSSNERREGNPPPPSPCARLARRARIFQARAKRNRGASVRIARKVRAAPRMAAPRRRAAMRRARVFRRRSAGLAKRARANAVAARRCRGNADTTGGNER